MEASIAVKPSAELPENLSWLPQPLPLQGCTGALHLLDASFCSLPLYFALKRKHGYILSNEATFVDALRAAVTGAAICYDVVLYPESRCDLLREITRGIPHAHEVPKRAKADICAAAREATPWSKLERLSQALAWAKMGEAFTINLIKSNQRKHYAPFLFEKQNIDANASVLLLDDFVMSGVTIKALAMCLGEQRRPPDVLGLFAQNGTSAN